MSDLHDKPHLTTNDKINLILNGPRDDEEDEYEKRAKLRRLKKRLQRSALYGSGPRTTLPNVKKTAKSTKSQFLFSSPESTIVENHKETTSIPPGAHDDQYRLVQNITTVNQNDPDRVFFTSTSMTNGVRHISQPPWYIGHQNKINPPDVSVITSAQRYGFRGSKQIRQYQTEPYMSPIRTRTAYTPKFLKTEPIENEWVPPLSASALNKGYQLTTPKMWPENSEYVTGYPTKTPTSIIYINETTVCDEERPAATKSMDAIHGMFIEEQSRLRDYSNLEKSRTLLSRPMTEQSVFRSSWEGHIEQNLNINLKNTKNSMKNKQQVSIYKGKKALLDATDALRCAKTSSIITHSQSSEVLKFRGRLEYSPSLIPYTIRWTEVYIIFKSMKSRLKKKDKSITEILQDISMKLHIDTITGGDIDVIWRSKFVQTLSSIELLNQIPATHFNSLYSAFDYFQSDCVKIVEIMAYFTILDNPMSDAMQKILSLWYLYDTLTHHYSPLETCLCVLTTCATSENNRKVMTELFKTKFKPKCYSTAIMKEPTTTQRPSIATSNTNTNINMTSSSLGTVHLAHSSSQLSNPLQEKNVQTAFNICDSFLDADMFVEVLEQCPEVVDEFDFQLSGRLVECFGTDSRIVDDSKDTDSDTKSERTKMKNNARKEIVKKFSETLFKSQRNNNSTK
eukprot:gene8464-17445_t